MSSLCVLSPGSRRRALMIAAAFAALQVAGCASVTLPAPDGTANNVERLKAIEAAPIAVGEFKAAPGKAADADRGLSIRGTNTIRPAGGSFATQLRDQLAAELKAAGLDGAGAKVAISGVVTDNALEAGIGTGTARLAARFQVKRDGNAVFEKEIVAASTWESSFIAAVAVPTAFNHYGALYKELVGKLLDDPELRAAVKR